jgi:DNA-binding PadR family transcriptional regulator
VSRTATTANAILGLLALRPSWSTWELTKQLRRNMRFFWPRAESRIYDEVKRLHERGLTDRERSHVGRRRRTSYSITAQGRRELRAWLAQPPRPTRLECEPLLRIMLADLATPEQLRVALEQVRADANAILDVGCVVGTEYLAGTAPFQDDVHARALVFDFLSHHALMLLAWSERAERTIAAWPESSVNERERAALTTIKRCLKEFPPEP